MKKGLLLLVLSIILSFIGLQARQLTPAQALSRLKSSGRMIKKRSLEINSESLSYSGASSSGETTWYAFNHDGNGWVILSASECGAPLLAYSETGQFNYAELPEAMRWWLMQYSQQIELSSASLYESEEIDYKNPIAPMLKTTWDQNAPFNLYTPEIDGAHAPTGCVATAMAQLMKYYNYPEQGSGILSYIMQGTSLSLDLSSFKFGWSEMTDNYFHNPTDKSIEAVAKLMQACGYAVESQYQSYATDAQVYQWPRALIENFNYAPSSNLISRIYYTDSDWEAQIYNSLSNGYPVLYSGLGSSGGHAFVCDGYSGDGYYHFNWGWGGLSDGYFLLSALNPTALGTGGGAGGFNSGQLALVNCRPNYEGSIMETKMGLLDSSTVTYSNVSKNFTLLGGIMNLSPCTLNAKVGFEIKASDGTTYYAGETNSPIEFALQNILQSYARKLTETLKDGNYEVRPVFGIIKDEKTEWKRVLMPVNMPQYWTLKVVNGKGEISETVVNCDVEVSNLKPTTGIYPSSQFKVEAKITNRSELEFMSDIYVLMYDNTGEITYISDANPVDIMGGKTCEVDFTCVPSGKLKAGNWKMGLGLLIDKNTKQYYPISDKVDVIVNPFQNDIVMEASDFKVLNSENVNPESITLSMNLKCVKGHYANPLRIWVRPVGSTGTWGQMMQTQFIYMEEGNNGEVNYTFCYPKGISGAEYELISNYVIPTSQSWLGTCKFRIGSASGIKTIESESDPIIWYNLQGIRCEPSSPGIYIKEFNGKRNKVIIK